jgi:hypothetical protein
MDLDGAARKDYELRASRSEPGLREVQRAPERD